MYIAHLSKQNVLCVWYHDRILMILLECPIGSFGKDCEKKCIYPFYGEDCQSRCNCSEDNCHFSRGCFQSVKTLQTSMFCVCEINKFYIKN